METQNETQNISLMIFLLRHLTAVYHSRGHFLTFLALNLRKGY